MTRNPASILYDAAGHPVAVVDDGGVYRLEASSKIARASDGAYVNPATEEKLEAARALLETIDGDTSNLDVALSTRATEATALDSDGRLTTIDSVLDAIKDTDGVKKITDQLPAGTNEIGKVAQGTKATGADGWPTVLYDAFGKAMAVENGVAIPANTRGMLGHAKDSSGDARVLEVAPDGSGYRLKTIAMLDPGEDGTGNRVIIYDDVNDLPLAVEHGVAVPANTRGWLVHGVDKNEDASRITARSIAGSNRLLVDALGSWAPDNLGTVVRDTLREPGGSDSMKVDGGTTPVYFDFLADPTDNIDLFELRLTMTASDWTLGDDHFGATGPLANGLRIAITSGGSEVELSNIKVNEDWFLIPFATMTIEIAGPKDYVQAAMQFGGVIRLHAGTADKVRITVRDDISASNRCYYLKAAALGIKEPV